MEQGATPSSAGCFNTLNAKKGVALCCLWSWSYTLVMLNNFPFLAAIAAQNDLTVHIVSDSSSSFDWVPSAISGVAALLGAAIGVWGTLWVSSSSEKRAAAKANNKVLKELEDSITAINKKCRQIENISLSEWREADLAGESFKPEHLSKYAFHIPQIEVELSELDGLAVQLSVNFGEFYKSAHIDELVEHVRKTSVSPSKYPDRFKSSEDPVRHLELEWQNMHSHYLDAVSNELKFYLNQNHYSNMKADKAAIENWESMRKVWWSDKSAGHSSPSGSEQPESVNTEKPKE